MDWLLLGAIVFIAIGLMALGLRTSRSGKTIAATPVRPDFVIIDSPGMYLTRLARNLEAAGFTVVHVAQPVYLSKVRLLHPALKRMVQEMLAIPDVIARCGRIHRDTVLIVPTMHVAYLAVAALLKALGQRRPLYLVNFYVHSRARWRIFRFVMRRLLTECVGIAVQSPGERDFYRVLSQLATIDYIPYGQDQHPVWDPSPQFAPMACTRYVFAGGYTNRDYSTLVRAAATMPDVQFVIVCSRHNVFERHAADNVNVIEDVSFRDFHALLARADVVVVPLLHDGGSSGQMVALAGMSYGVPVVYTDFSTVAQYFVPYETGVPVPCRDADALAHGITGLLQSPQQAKAIAAAARFAYLERFTADRSLASVAESAAAFWSTITANPARQGRAITAKSLDDTVDVHPTISPDAQRKGVKSSATSPGR
jgi:glycosyltransferase involved in cell wall biosynthesis